MFSSYEVDLCTVYETLNAIRVINDKVLKSDV